MSKEISVVKLQYMEHTRSAKAIAIIVEKTTAIIKTVLVDRLKDQNMIVFDRLQ